MSNGIYTVAALGTDDNGAAAPALPVPFVIDNDCVQDSDCDDGLWCTGAETCNETFGACTLAEAPCGSGLVCDEDNDTCVECLADADCGFGYECVSSVCAVGCPLTVKVIKDKPMRADAKKKVARMLIITGGEGFNPAGRIDLGPLTLEKGKNHERRQSEDQGDNSVLEPRPAPTRSLSAHASVRLRSCST
jgi:hypothetical protein